MNLMQTLIAPVAILLVALSTPLTRTAVGQSPAADRAALLEALHFHAPFDAVPDAKRFSKDGRIQTADSVSRNTLTPGIQRPDVTIAQGEGKFGDCLRFTAKVPEVLCFAGTEMHYDRAAWSGSVSLWLRLDPDEDLLPGFCDPLLITQHKWDDGALFIDFDKELPRDLRLGVFSDLSHWNPQNIRWGQWPVEQRPMVVAKHPPFDRAAWTHVAFTFENINPAAGQSSSATLYLNGQAVGSLEQPLKFSWQQDQAAIMLGINYIGDMDELMIFRRSLSEAEIRYLYQSPTSL